MHVGNANQGRQIKSDGSALQADKEHDALTRRVSEIGLDSGGGGVGEDNNNLTPPDTTSAPRLDVDVRHSTLLRVFALCPRVTTHASYTYTILH